MSEFKIDCLNSEARKLINKHKIDRNKDGIINSDNGELAELLSKSGKSDINELVKQYDREGFLLFGKTALCVSAGLYGKKLYKDGCKKLPLSEACKQALTDIKANCFERKIHNSLAAYKKTVIGNTPHEKNIRQALYEAIMKYQTKSKIKRIAGIITMAASICTAGYILINAIQKFTSANNTPAAENSEN